MRFLSSGFRRLWYSSSSIPSPNQPFSGMGSYLCQTSNCLSFLFFWLPTICISNAHVGDISNYLTYNPLPSWREKIGQSYSQIAIRFNENWIFSALVSTCNKQTRYVQFEEKQWKWWCTWMNEQMISSETKKSIWEENNISCVIFCP